MRGSDREWNGERVGRGGDWEGHQSFPGKIAQKSVDVKKKRRRRKAPFFMQQEWRHDDDDDNDEAGFLVLRMHSSDVRLVLVSKLFVLSRTLRHFYWVWFRRS